MYIQIKSTKSFDILTRPSGAEPYKQEQNHTRTKINKQKRNSFYTIPFSQKNKSSIKQSFYWLQFLF